MIRSTCRRLVVAAGWHWQLACQWPMGKTTAHYLAVLLFAIGIAGPTDRRAHAQEREWPDPVANHVVPYQSTPLTHGPMLGRPDSDSVRIWVRTEDPMDFTVHYDTDLPLDGDSPSVTGTTRKDHDNTGYVDIEGLKPNTRYAYAVVVGGQTPDLRMNLDRPWPHFRTLPDETSFAHEKNPEGLFNFKFAIGACASQQPSSSGGHYGSPPAYRSILRDHEDVRFTIVNGDFIYEELRNGKVSGYRANYRRYLSRGRSVAELYRYMPGLFTFDDHEIGGDVQGPGEVGLRSGLVTNRDKALGPWYEYLGWANFEGPDHGRIRIGKADIEKGSEVLTDSDADFSDLDPETVSTLHVWSSGKNQGVYGLESVAGKHRLKVRPAFRANQKGVRYSIGTHHYFEKKLGNTHFFFLDCRSERTSFSRQERRSEDRYILGQAQERWLLNGVRETDADFIFVVSSVAWTVFHTAGHVGGSTKPKGDTFGGYLHQRKKLLDAFDKVGKPVILFTGDLHNSMSIKVTDNVWEMLVAPLSSTAHPISTAGNPPFGGTFDSEGRDVKIKWTLGFPNDVHYSRLRTTSYAVVQVNNVMKAARPKERGYQWVAYDAPQVVVRFHDGHTGKLRYAEGISTAGVEAEP